MLIDISISRAKTKEKSGLQKGEAKVIRSFENGAIEIEDHRGRRWRGNASVCSMCEKPVFGVSTRFLSEPFCCSGCNELKRVERIEKRDVAHAERRRVMIERGETSPQRRQALLFFASVKWRDKSAIREIYMEARKKTEETGIPHHVDHIYPIQGLLGCGLHVSWNLQVMVGSENCSKGNGFPLEQSPAWDDCDMAEIHRETLKMIRDYEEGLDKGPKACAISARS